ncbi:hypothetical protein PR048_023413 [Dryococelus australis]|uniref:Uncharacterized protein n=1 Tax=Dryococelus australis TaxID=614101 RepID=A0ABQ9GU06_9NEOP|nr:hypothetical protein PR048_023413 [Dryococelus australis]
MTKVTGPIPDKHHSCTIPSDTHQVTTSLRIPTAVFLKLCIPFWTTSPSLLLYRKCGSRHLVNLISNISKSIILITTKIILSVLFDNDDYVSTIYGMNTFHAMGGIKCITPGRIAEKETEMTKVKEIPSAEDIGQLGYVPLQVFKNTVTGLGNVTMEDLQYLNPLTGYTIAKCR